MEENSNTRNNLDESQVYVKVKQRSISKRHILMIPCIYYSQNEKIRDMEKKSVVIRDYGKRM